MFDLPKIEEGRDLTKLPQWAQAYVAQLIECAECNKYRADEEVRRRDEATKPTPFCTERYSKHPSERGFIDTDEVTITVPYRDGTADVFTVKPTDEGLDLAIDGIGRGRLAVTGHSSNRMFVTTVPVGPLGGKTPIECTPMGASHRPG